MTSATSRPTPPVVLLSAVWHGLLTLILLGLAGWAMFAIDEPNTWLSGLAVAVLLLGAITSGIAATLLAQCQSTGRLLGLSVSYLWSVACGLGLLHWLGVFVGIDAWAGTFGAGLPFLLAALLAWFLRSWGEERFAPTTWPIWQTAWGAVGAVAALVALWQMNALGGLMTILQNFDTWEEATLAGGLVLGVSMVAVQWHTRFAEMVGARHMQEETLSGLLFLSPNFLGFLIFFAGPLVLSFYTSFTNWDAFGTRDWVGLNNYLGLFDLSLVALQNPSQAAIEVLNVMRYTELTRFEWFGTWYLLGAHDHLFWIALSNTLRFVLLAVPFSVIPALMLANVLNSKLPGMQFFRVIYFLPSIAAVVGIALVWQWLFNATVGYINYFVTVITGWLSQPDPKIKWLSDANVALLAITIVAAWQTMGFNTVLFLAGLQNVPGELYEAATVDGAGRWDKFWSITLPLLAPTTFFVVSTTTIQALQVFEQVFVMTNPPGAPGNATLTLVLYLYQKGFQSFKQGEASAIAWVLFLVIFVVTLLQFRRQRQDSIYEN